MHRQLLLPIVIASSLIFAGAARADGYEPVARAAPVSLQVSNWTGFYANGGVGYGLFDAETTANVVGGGCVLGCLSVDHGGRGWLGEVGVGYDYQVGEQDRHWRPLQLRFLQHNRQDQRRARSVGQDQQRLDLVRRRPRWLADDPGGPQLLERRLYGDALRCVPTSAVARTCRSYDAGGWFLGGGLEVAMHDGWFWRSEVRYSDYSSDVRTETGVAPASTSTSIRS